MVNTFVDGSGWNNINSAICVIRNKKKYIKVFEEPIKIPTIEIMAIKKGVEICKEGDVIFSDSKTIVEAINKDTAYPNKLFEETKEELLGKKIKIKWCRRENNIAGKYLEKRLKRLHRHAQNTVNRSIRLVKDIERSEKVKRIYGGKGRKGICQKKK